MRENWKWGNVWWHYTAHTAILIVQEHPNPALGSLKILRTQWWGGEEPEMFVHVDTESSCMSLLHAQESLQSPKPNYEHLPWPPPVMSFSHGWRSELPSRMDILSLVDDGACWDDWDCAVMLAGLWIQACGDCRCESRKCILQLTENREYKGQTAVRQTCEGRAEVGVMWLLVLIMQEEGCQPGITCGHCKLEKTSAPWGRNHVCFAAGPSRGLRFNQCFIKERTNESSLPDCTKVGKLKQM